MCWCHLYRAAEIQTHTVLCSQKSILPLNLETLYEVDTKTVSSAVTSAVTVSALYKPTSNSWFSLPIISMGKWFYQMLTQRNTVVMVRPNQSWMLKIRKQHTEIKKRSEEWIDSKRKMRLEDFTITLQHISRYSVSVCWMQQRFNPIMKWNWRWGHTPFSWERGPDICSNGREDRQSDCEHKRHAERHHPDLKIKEERKLFN